MVDSLVSRLQRHTTRQLWQPAGKATGTPHKSTFHKWKQVDCYQPKIAAYHQREKVIGEYSDQTIGEHLRSPIVLLTPAYIFLQNRLCPDVLIVIISLDQRLREGGDITQPEIESLASHRVDRVCCIANHDYAGA
jgi:hypothetical protein